MALKLKKEKARLENAKTPEEQEKIFKETLDEGKVLIQSMISDALKKGFDLPDELKDRMQSSEFGKGFDIEQKMSLREK